MMTTKNGAEPIQVATEKIDFKDLVSAPASRSMVSKDYAKFTKANAKRSMFGNIKSFEGSLRNAKNNYNGRMVNIKHDLKTMEIVDSAF